MAQLTVRSTESKAWWNRSNIAAILQADDIAAAACYPGEMNGQLIYTFDFGEKANAHTVLFTGAHVLQCVASYYFSEEANRHIEENEKKISADIKEYTITLDNPNEKHEWGTLPAGSFVGLFKDVRSDGNKYRLVIQTHAGCEAQRWVNAQIRSLNNPMTLDDIQGSHEYTDFINQTVCNIKRYLGFALRGASLYGDKYGVVGVDVVEEGLMYTEIDPTCLAWSNVLCDNRFHSHCTVNRNLQSDGSSLSALPVFFKADRSLLYYVVASRSDYEESCHLMPYMPLMIDVNKAILNNNSMAIKTLILSKNNTIDFVAYVTEVIKDLLNLNQHHNLTIFVEQYTLVK